MPDMDDVMPRYLSHKQAWAIKIAAIETLEGGGAILTPAEVECPPVEVTSDYMQARNPQVGGYYVLYVDGHATYSPAVPFEAGYSRLS